MCKQRQFVYACDRVETGKFERCVAKIQGGSNDKCDNIDIVFDQLDDYCKKHLVSESAKKVFRGGLQDRG